MSDFVSPTNPENLVMGWRPNFVVGPFENMGLLYGHRDTNPRNGVNYSWYSSHTKYNCSYYCDTDKNVLLPSSEWVSKSVHCFDHWGDM